MCELRVRGLAVHLGDGCGYGFRGRRYAAPRNDKGMVMSTLRDFSGTLVLVGAGKMGGAMLEGWLALGLEPAKIAVMEPKPAEAIAALEARGVRLNPASVQDASVIVIAIKPQDAASVVPTLKPLAKANTVVISIMA